MFPPSAKATNRKFPRRRFQFLPSVRRQFKNWGVVLELIYEVYSKEFVVALVLRTCEDIDAP